MPRFRWIFGHYRVYASTGVDSLLLKVEEYAGKYDWYVVRLPGGLVVSSLQMGLPLLTSQQEAILDAEAYFVKTFLGSDRAEAR